MPLLKRLANSLPTSRRSESPPQPIFRPAHDNTTSTFPSPQPPPPNVGVSGTACFPRSIVGDATLPSNRLRCPTAKPCPLHAGLGQTQSLSKLTTKANRQKAKRALGLARNCGKKPHQNPTSARLKKQPLLSLLKFTPQCGSQLARSRPHHRPLAATRSNRLARPQSPPSLHQRHRLWPTANLHKPRLALKSPARHKTAPPIFTAYRAPRPAPAPQPSGSTTPPQPPQPRERSLTPHSAPYTNQPPPNFQSPCAALPTATPPNLPATAQPAAFTSSKSCVLATSASSFRLLCASSSAPAQRWRQRHGVFTQKHCWRRYSAFKPPTLPHGVAVSAARGVRHSRDCVLAFQPLTKRVSFLES